MKFYLFIAIWMLMAFWPLQAQVLSANEGVLSVEKCLAIAAEKEGVGDKKEATRFLNQAANIEWENKNYSAAIQHFEKSIKLNTQIGNWSGVSTIHNNLGLIYADTKQFEKALTYFQKTYDYRRDTGDKINTISSIVNISVVLNNLKRYSESANYLESALTLARELNDAEQMRSCYGMLSETYEKAGNTAESIRYFNLYRSFHEESQRRKEKEYKGIAEKAQLEALLTEEKKKLAELEVLVKEKELQEKEFALTASDRKAEDLSKNLTKKELAIRFLEKENEARRKDAEIKGLKIKEINLANQARTERERLIRYGLISGLFLLSLIAFLIFRQYLKNRRTNKQLSAQNQAIMSQQAKILEQNQALEQAYDEIKDKNEDITASIQYAQRIQTAMLVSGEQMFNHLPEHFILWKPRDIVSGDFYWFAEKEGKIILAAIDCTGHGVPGAFVSMLGDSLLNQIVHDKGIIEADKILNELHLGVKTNLNQHQNQNRDGMDIALCVIDPHHKKMEYAGANNPLYYIQNQELTQVKADKFGIGGYEIKTDNRERLFTKHTIDISEPTQIYLFSDGYQDQFGGEKDSKFMVKRFRELLFEIHNQPLPTQEYILNNTIEEWMNVAKARQIDDILVIGAKLAYN
jgi:serine phosphatase RsbU (regulator of sigma subunit)